MNEKNRTSLLVTVFSMSQIVLREYGLIDKEGRPLKLKKDQRTEKHLDAIYIYEWASVAVKHVSQYKLDEIGREVNQMANSLSDDYMMNKYLFVLMLLDNYVHNELSVIDQNLLKPKVDRLIKLMREDIVTIKQATKEEIIKDSATLASNVWNLFNDKLELTKEVREARLRIWREAARNKPKEKESVLKKYKF